MKSIQTTVMCAAIACSTPMFAQNEAAAPAGISMPTNPEQTMTAKEKILLLKPATNPVELMQLLKTVHDEKLLLEPYFMEDENILRLFGDAKIETKNYTNVESFSKHFEPNAKNPFQFPIWFFGTKRDLAYGSISVGNVRDALPFNHEVIEAHLLPDVQGADPLHPLNGMTNEARNYAGSRPRATHPKGYWTYADGKTWWHSSISLRVKLDRNAQVLNIDLTQRQDQKWQP
jgi:hypothetical protein